MSSAEPIRKLGRYELLKRIAKGGMGEIYLARSRGAAGFEKTCIIKTILPHLAEEEEFVTKFLDEGHIVVQLVHGNIVPVFDMGDEDGEAFIAMEYIPGRDLREVTKRLAARGQTMPVDLALFVASEVCKGLDYAHRKTDEAGNSLGIVHRDVSPSNVLISREGEVKLIDFGIARAAGKLGKTVSGRIQGKFCYMSPEQASGKPLDGRSDIFSAGLVLYELLTGFRPFEGDSDLESLDLVRRCEFDAPGALNVEVPAEIDDIVSLALEQAPEDRYPSIDKLQIALLQYLYSTGSSPTSSDLAGFLSELFPEGLEREELRSARDSGPPKAMSLDQALDFELGLLAGGVTSDVDPHETTAVSSDEVRLRTPNSKTRTKPDRPDAEDPAEVPELSPLATTEATRRPWLAPVVIAAILLLAGAVFSVTASSKGERTIDSDPPGAQISVDGLLIPGALTPHTLALSEGEHTIELDLEGHEAAALKVEVEAGSALALAVTKLKAVEAPSGPKTFRLHATPLGAEFVLDGAVLGSPTITLTPGQVVRVVARHADCQSMTKTVDYGQSNLGVSFDLSCEAVPDMGEAATPDPQPESVRRVSIKSSPVGAEIIVNGKSLGSSPVVWTGPSNAMLEIVAQKDGLEAVTVKRRAAQIRDSLTLRLKSGEEGCIDLSIINPMIAQWFVDGTALGEKRGFKNHRLSVGTHTVHVKNASTGLDHSQSVKVERGDSCTRLLLDGARLGK